MQTRPPKQPSPPRPRQRRRELFAMFFAFVLTAVIGRQIIPPNSRGPLILEIVVYVLLYGSLYALFWWLGGYLAARRGP